MKNNNKSKLQELLQIEKQVATLASSEIVFPPALVSLGTIPVIKRGTVNVIQGSFGSHKSRFAELMCSMMIRDGNDPELSLGFEKLEDEEITVCYIDTERNCKEEFPQAIQNIVKNAGYNTSEEAATFRFTSVKSIDRRDRKNEVKNFVEEIRAKSTNPLFVVLDVVTDCVANFNDPAESLALFDYFGTITEKHNATLLLVIHENPGGDKAKGHVGTEAINKASTVLKIGFTTTNGVRNPDSLTLKFLKTRHSGTIPSIPLQFCEITKSLRIREFSNSRSIGKPMVSADSLRTKLGEYLSEAREGQILLDMIRKDFQGSENTIKARLSEISNKGVEILDTQSRPTTLLISANSGKKTLYQLVEVPVEHL